MILPALIALGLGAAGGYAVSRFRAQLREAELKKQLEEQANRKALPCPPVPTQGPVPTPLPQEKYRAPDPRAVINVPIDKDDFAQMADAFCTCWKALAKEHGRAPTVDELRDCFLEALYPDFSWPPVPGDPASAQLLWMIADHEARKLIADPKSCIGMQAGVISQGGGG